MTSTGPARQASLRERNLATIARAVIDAPDPLSRADLAACTGMTRATVSTLVDQLVEAGLLTELPAVASGPGRPAVPLAPAARTVVGLGLEVNVDYLGGRVVDLTGAIVDEFVIAGTLRGSSATATLRRLGHLARDLIARVESRGMRIAGAHLALPGLVDTRTNLLRIAPNLGWSDVEPLPLLGLPAGLPATVGNEAKLAALAQLWGCPVTERASRTFLYVSGDVGIGAAIVIDGELFGGRRGWSGELGHITIDPAGPRCGCGATGCLERYAGKEVLVTDVGLGIDVADDVLVDRLSAADDAARAAVTTAGAALGQAMADAVNLLDIDTVLLGGVYTGLVPLLRPTITEQLRTRVLGAPWAPVDVAPAPVANHAALTGGAATSLRAVVADPMPWIAAAAG
ncbi:ROK family transcriptional regulator [Haloechinothrix halophila]|uniref:ROK family transcriptional regulator n=1 Tax=Haloechinothrix halophila TaxID=1069073 RepID=UPI0004012693|nr:ROK family transcriptional regulator [Haloechinothrix halophila]